MTKNDILALKNDLPNSRTIDILLIEGFSMLSYAAVIEPFRAANIHSGKTLYSWRHLTPQGRPAAASNGAMIDPESDCTTSSSADFIIVIAGGEPALFNDQRVFAWLRRAAIRGASLVGVSGGPFLLAKAGLLDGYRATVHWDHQPEFTETFPDVLVKQTLFVFDRTRVTCAGGIAGLDMAIELIAYDHGRILAARIAEWFISTQVRDASGQQRGAIGTRFGITSTPLTKALELMERHIEEPLAREMIAQKSGVTLRHLERLFAQHLSSTINRFGKELRLDHAAHLLRATDLSVAQTSVACGFMSIAHFSRAFKAYHGVAPGAMRNAYRKDTRGYER